MRTARRSTGTAGRASLKIDLLLRVSDLEDGEFHEVLLDLSNVGVLSVVEPNEVAEEKLGNQSDIGHSNFIANAILASALLHNLFEGAQESSHPGVGPSLS